MVPGRSRSSLRSCLSSAGRGRGRLRGALLLGLRRFHHDPLPQRVAVATHVLVDDALALDHERARHDVVEQLAVVADHQDRALVVDEQVLEELQRLQVEVVRRLVEHEHVRRPREEAGEQQAVPLPAGERADRAARLVRREEEVPQVRDDLTRLAVHLDRRPAVVDVVGRGRVVVEHAWSWSK